MNAVGRKLALFAAAVALGGCGLFGDDDELEPAELIDFEPTLRIDRLWSQNLGAGHEFLRLALRPAGDGSNLYAASRDGRVYSLDPASGRENWRVDLDVGLSAGPGVGGGLVVVLSNNGEVITLEATDGAERWRAKIDGESLATPAIAAGNVIVQTVDNRLRALDSYTGSERWTLIRDMPLLTMRGTTSPIVLGSNVITGFDNGRLVAVDIDSGEIEWETLLAPPSGRSDLERLSDIDGAITAVGQDIYAAGYQGRIAAVAGESGQLLWATEISSYEGVAADWTSLYTTQDNGTVIAMSRRNGAEDWRQDALLRREPTLAVPFDTTVVVGDLEGYLHFFSNIDGEPVARERFGSDAISADPYVMGERLFVQSDNGSVSAWVVRRPEQPPRAPDIADEDG